MKRMGIAFLTTPKGKHRARIGPVEQGPAAAVVAPVLVSETFDTASEAADAVADVFRVAAVQGIEPIGEAPATWPQGWTPGFGEPVPDVIEPPSAPAELLQYPDAAGEVRPFDRRQLSVMAALDRKWDGLAARGARRIWQYVSEGMTVARAVEEVNRTMQMGLTFRDGYDLAQRELYRLAAHVAIVQNRDLAPRMPEKVVG